jgi:hypothetical protein
MGLDGAPNEARNLLGSHRFSGSKKISEIRDTNMQLFVILAKFLLSTPVRTALQAVH